MEDVNDAHARYMFFFRIWPHENFKDVQYNYIQMFIHDFSTVTNNIATKNYGLRFLGFAKVAAAVVTPL